MNSSKVLELSQTFTNSCSQKIALNNPDAHVARMMGFASFLASLATLPHFSSKARVVFSAYKIRSHIKPSLPCTQILSFFNCVCTNVQLYICSLHLSLSTICLEQSKPLPIGWKPKHVWCWVPFFLPLTLLPTPLSLYSNKYYLNPLFYLTQHTQVLLSCSGRRTKPTLASWIGCLWRLSSGQMHHTWRTA